MSTATSMPTDKRRWWLVPIVVYVANIVLFAARSPLNVTAFPLDDAWIHRVYAHAFAYGHGFAYNAGEQTTGFTSPLWVVITAPAHWLEPLGTAAVVVAVKVIGTLLGALTVAAVYRLALHASRASWAAVAAASAVACQPVLAFSALAGMETVLVLALWSWLVLAVHERQSRRAAIVTGLLSVARPEGIVLAGITIVVVAIAHRRALRDALRTRAALVALAWVVAPTLVWILYCQVVSGHPLPATYYMKAHAAISGDVLVNAGTLLTEHGLARWLPLAIIGAASVIWCVRACPSVALLGGGSLAFVAAILVTRSISLTGYYWSRWTDPGVLGWTSAWMVALAAAAASLQRSNLAPRVRWAALGVIAVVVVAGLPGLAKSLDERATRFASDARVIERMNVAPGRWIAEHVPPNAVVGVNDAGALRYFGQRTTIDIVGLNNLDVAFHRVPIETIVRRLDWIAAYPIYVSGLAAVARFKPITGFSIPPAEYTICDCPGQSLMTVSKRADDLLLPEQREALISALRPAGPASAWLAVSPRDADAVADAAELQAAFEAAGWHAQTVQLAFRLRPGLTVLASDNPPSPSAEAVRHAFEMARVPVVFAAGYRAELARNPTTMRIDLAPDQAFVLAVGRRGP